MDGSFSSARFPAWDRDSFERLYAEHARLIYAVVARLGVPDHDRDDLIQEVFVTAYRRTDAFDPSLPAAPWLAGIARKVVSRYRRTQARRVRKHAAVAEVVDGVLGGEDPYVASDFLRRFLQRLDPDRRRVFVLAELYGLTGREIAESLSINANTAATRLRAVRRELRSELTAAVDGTEDRPSSKRLQAIWVGITPALGTPGLGGLFGLAASMHKAALVAVGVATLTIVGVGVTSDPAPPSTPRHAATTPPEPTSPVAVERRERASAEHLDAMVELAAAEPREVTPAMPRRPSPRTMPARTPAPGPTTGPDSIAQETRLVRAAREAIRDGKPSRALAYTGRYAKRFPTGVLYEANARLRMDALCGLGRSAEARTLAGNLASQRPNSLLARQVKDPCAADEPVAPANDAREAGRVPVIPSAG